MSIKRKKKTKRTINHYHNLKQKVTKPFYDECLAMDGWISIPDQDAGTL